MEEGLSCDSTQSHVVNCLHNFYYKLFTAIIISYLLLVIILIGYIKMCNSKYFFIEVWLICIVISLS